MTEPNETFLLVFYGDLFWVDGWALQGRRRNLDSQAPLETECNAVYIGEGQSQVKEWSTRTIARWDLDGQVKVNTQHWVSFVQMVDVNIFLTRKFIVGHMLLDAITDLFFKMHLQSTVL